MANKFQVKRTSVSGRTPNTTNSGNTHFIDTGELALNLTDGKLFSSNGSASFEIGANLSNLSVSGNSTIGAIVANGSTGSAGQTLTSNGTGIYWATGAGTGTVTQVNTGTGLTGGPITSSGTLSVLANSGIIANTTGVYVNSTYISTLSSNNSSFLNGVAASSYVQNTDSRTLSGNLVISGTYFNPSANTVLLGNSTQRWVVSANTINASGLLTTSAGANIVGDLRISNGVVANGSLGTAGQTLASNGSSVYWANTITSILTASTTAPVSPADGNFWYKTTTDVLYQYFDDGTSSYWVDVITPVIGGSATSNVTPSVSNNVYSFSGTTTGSTETEIFVGGIINSRIAVAANTTVSYDVTITARRTDTIGFSAGFNLKGVVDNFSGTVADVGTLYENVIARDDSNYLVDVRADDINNTLNVYVTGVAGHTIKWVATVTTFEVQQ